MDPEERPKNSSTLHGLVSGVVSSEQVQKKQVDKEGSKEMSTLTKPAFGSVSGEDFETPDIDRERTEIAPLEFKLSEYQKLLDSFSLHRHGDGREQEFCKTNIAKLFPHYETLWRIVCVPATERMIRKGIQPRRQISQDVVSMCQFHYSMMRSLLLAEKQATSVEDGSMEAFFMHLENAMEQVELFLLFWMKLFLRPRPKAVRRANIRSRKSVERGSRSDLLKLYFNSVEWQRIQTIRDETQTIRDNLVHGPVPLTVQDGDKLLYPSIKSLKSDDFLRHPQYWRNFFRETSEKGVDHSIFEEQRKIKQEHLERTVKFLNGFWKAHAEDSKKRFFTPEVKSFYGLSIKNG